MAEMVEAVVMVQVVNTGKAVMRMEMAMMSEGGHGNSDADGGRDSGGNRGAWQHQRVSLLPTGTGKEGMTSVYGDADTQVGCWCSLRLF